MIMDIKRKIKDVKNLLKLSLNKILISFLSKKLYDSLPDNFKDFGVIVEHYSKKIDNFFFIQIGSNDGFSGDPIHRIIIKYRWDGILIEPVKYIFKRLIQNYRKRAPDIYKRLIFENVAISNKNQYRNLYRLKRNLKGMPRWYEQIGSFDKKTVLKNKRIIANIEKYLVVEKVRCITFKELIKRNKVKKIDLLHLDTEGFDYEIIKLIDFTKLKPKMIFYEHMHLNKKDVKECENLLKDQGYSLTTNKSDTLAILKSI